MRIGLGALIGVVLALGLGAAGAQAGPWSQGQSLPGGHHEELFTDGNGGGVYLYLDGSEDCWRLYIQRRSSTPEQWAPAPGPTECVKAGNEMATWGPNGEVLISYAVPKEAGNPEGIWVRKLYVLPTPTSPLPEPIIWEPPVAMPLTPGNTLVDNGNITARSVVSLDASGRPHVFWSTPVDRPDGFDQSGIGWSHHSGGAWSAPQLAPGDTSWDFDVSNAGLEAVPTGEADELVFLAEDAEFFEQRTKHLITVKAGEAPSDEPIEFAGPSGDVRISTLLGSQTGVHFLAAVGSPTSMAEPFANRELQQVTIPPGGDPAVRSPGPYTLGGEELLVMPNGDAVAAWVNLGPDKGLPYKLHTSRRSADSPFGAAQIFDAGEVLTMGLPKFDTDPSGRILLSFTDSDEELHDTLMATVAEPGQPFAPLPVSLPHGRRDGACERSQIGAVIDDFGRVTVLTREVNAVQPIAERNFSFTATLPLESADNRWPRNPVPCRPDAVAIKKLSPAAPRLPRAKKRRSGKAIGATLVLAGAADVQIRSARFVYKAGGKRRSVPVLSRQLRRQVLQGRTLQLTLRLPAARKRPQPPAGQRGRLELALRAKAKGSACWPEQVRRGTRAKVTSYTRTRARAR